MKSTYIVKFYQIKALFWFCRSQHASTDADLSEVWVNAGFLIDCFKGIVAPTPFLSTS